MQHDLTVAARELDLRKIEPLGFGKIIFPESLMTAHVGHLSTSIWAIPGGFGKYAGARARFMPGLPCLADDPKR